jgi:4-aminobutyrate aminotransferase/(S)-3-amino-2-methylpropionate transaminase
MTVAKSIAGGVPLSAVIGKAEIMDAPVVGGLGGTFAGSPLACAAGLAVLEVLREGKTQPTRRAAGAKLASRLRQMQARFPCIGEVRALGMMVADRAGEESPRRHAGCGSHQDVVQAAADAA